MQYVINFVRFAFHRYFNAPFEHLFSISTRAAHPITLPQTATAYRHDICVNILNDADSSLTDKSKPQPHQIQKSYSKFDKYFGEGLGLSQLRMLPCQQPFLNTFALVDAQKEPKGDFSNIVENNFSFAVFPSLRHVHG